MDAANPEEESFMGQRRQNVKGKEPSKNSLKKLQNFILKGLRIIANSKTYPQL